MPVPCLGIKTQNITFSLVIYFRNYCYGLRRGFISLSKKSNGQYELDIYKNNGHYEDATRQKVKSFKTQKAGIAKAKLWMKKHPNG